MSILLIGKSTLEDLGLCQVPSKMKGKFEQQLELVKTELCKSGAPDKLLMTSMTGAKERSLTNSAYFPKIRMYFESLDPMFDPLHIMKYCELNMDQFRPGADFIMWNTKMDNVTVSTFSREAPILAFENSYGFKCLGTILRPSLMKYGDYLFGTIEKTFGVGSKASLVCCNHHEYKEGSIPSIVYELADKHHMHASVLENSNSEENPECYHRGESGNHVVAMW